MKIRKKEQSVQYSVIYVLIMIVVIGAVTAGYVVSDRSTPVYDKVVPGNFFNSEVRSGSQVIEVSIIP